jgi:DeoR family transcriptional regulator, suf operon transcriptional repressor
MDRELNDTISDQLQPTRRKIVLALKQHGGLTAAELAEMLGITSMGVRRHLTTLERDKLVRYELVQRGKGRPSYVYRLSAQAENLFPKNYAQLANELLGYLASDEGETTVIKLFERRAQRRIRNAEAQLAGKPLAERVAGLALLLSNEGYLAEFEQEDEGTFWLREHNCAVHDVANEFSAACQSELTFLQAILPDAYVTREHHMMGGELMCAYRIESKPAADHE